MEDTIRDYDPNVRLYTNTDGCLMPLRSRSSNRMGGEGLFENRQNYPKTSGSSSFLFNPLRDKKMSERSAARAQKTAERAQKMSERMARLRAAKGKK